jgi:transcriptional regulator with XRE-family HTH domain
MGTSGESELKRARLQKNLTLEEAVAQLNKITGGMSDTSQLSAWESGRRRTGLRNRRGLVELYGKPSEALFAHQDRQSGVAQALHQAQGTLVTRWSELVEAMTSVVTGAREHLVVTGSRSREKGYLGAIETAVAQNPDLVHTRVLYGPPRHPELTDHLARLMELRDPAARRNGVRTLSIGIVDPGETWSASSWPRRVRPWCRCRPCTARTALTAASSWEVRPRPVLSAMDEKRARRHGCWARYGTCGHYPCATDREVGVGRT